MLDGNERRLDDDALSFEGVETVDLVVDRISFATASRLRIADAVEQAATSMDESRSSSKAGLGSRVQHPRCLLHVRVPVERGRWSLVTSPFNTHVGACKRCDGIGEVFRADPALLVTDPTRLLTDGAIEASSDATSSRARATTRHCFARSRARIASIWTGRSGSFPKHQALLKWGKARRGPTRFGSRSRCATSTTTRSTRLSGTGCAGHIDVLAPAHR